MKKKQFSLSNSSLQKYLSLLWRFWMKYFRFSLILMFLLAFTFLFFVWFENLSNIDRNVEDRRVQLEQRTKEVEFDEISFNNIIEWVDERREEMMQKTENVNDIFFPDQLPSRAIDQREISPAVDDGLETVAQEQSDTKSFETLIDEQNIDAVQISDQDVSAEDSQGVEDIANN